MGVILALEEETEKLEVPNLGLVEIDPDRLVLQEWLEVLILNPGRTRSELCEITGATEEEIVSNLLSLLHRKAGRIIEVLDGVLHIEGGDQNLEASLAI